MEQSRRSVSDKRRVLRTFTQFMRAHDSLRARLEPEITRHGITTTQFGVLEALLHLGPLNHGQIAEKILSSKGNITTVVDNLVRDGLVERRPVKGDRRQMSVRLTPAGSRLVGRIFPQQADAIARELSVLNDDELDVLGDLCKRLGGVAGNDSAVRGRPSILTDLLDPWS